MAYSFHYQQDDLNKICQDRPLITSEKHDANDFYGQASILKRYCGIKESKPLKLIYEHSLKLHTKIWDYDLETNFPTAFTSSKIRYKCFLNTNKFKFVIPIGPPILYAKVLVEEELKRRGIPITRKKVGTIVFPSHSTHHISAEFDQNAFINRLLTLTDDFKPIVICVYWKDYLDGKHKIYEKSGFKVVSAGHIYDKDFLLRFYDLCSQFKYSFANNLGSDLFYSTLCGCQYFCDYSIKIDYKNPLQYDLYDSDNEVLLNKQIAQSLFKEPSEISPSKARFIEAVSGVSFKRSKSVLYTLILISEVLWKLTLINKRGRNLLLKILK